MKAEEALKYLELIDNVTIDYSLVQLREIDFDKAEELASEAINVAYEALESQAPRVPVEQKNTHQERIGRVRVGECPICQWAVVFYESYCSNCGQRLDWR